VKPRSPEEAAGARHRPASWRELRELRSLLAYQFGPGAERLLEGRVEVRLSPLTGRIREVYVDGELVGTIRASDGFFVPSIRGAERILALLESPRSRVIVRSDVAQFVAEGRSAFCKHVVAADPEIRPGDEVAVVDERGGLLAVGRAVISGCLMSSKKLGVAVKVRKGTKG